MLTLERKKHNVKQWTKNLAQFAISPSKKKLPSHKLYYTKYKPDANFFYKFIK